MNSKQINIRLAPSAYEQFQAKVKKDGRSTNRLISKWISEYVETGEPRFSEVASYGGNDPDSLASPSLSALASELTKLQQRIVHLEQTIFLLSLVQLKEDDISDRRL
ncbi:MAG: hypothetical protein HC763_29160 [Hydrococcus sp. CRU_1_1]|nr:hypothetical protein [Hydrococcus sp. CRU_1_1]